MIEFGKTLRAAREAKGFTVGQLAELTRMAPMTVQELEAENFSRIAAPIYGRGFVKLYCEAVGIDPKPLVDEFMEIYSGNRTTEIKERPLPAAAQTETSVADPIEAVPAPCHVPEPPAPEPDLFQQLPETDSAPAAPEPSLSRYAAPIRQTQPLVDLQILLRLGTLVAGALLLIALLVWGFRAVYHATRADRGGNQTAEVTPATPSPEKQTPRVPQKIPSLYLD